MYVISNVLNAVVSHRRAFRCYKSVPIIVKVFLWGCSDCGTDSLLSKQMKIVAVHVLGVTEDSQQQPKPESQRLLDRVSELIASLHQAQNARLSSQPPAHLSDVSSPSPEETNLGNLRSVFTSVPSLSLFWWHLYYV